MAVGTPESPLGLGFLRMDRIEQAGIRGRMFWGEDTNLTHEERACSNQKPAMTEQGGGWILRVLKARWRRWIGFIGQQVIL